METCVRAESIYKVNLVDTVLQDGSKWFTFWITVNWKSRQSGSNWLPSLLQTWQNPFTSLKLPEIAVAFPYHSLPSGWTSCSPRKTLEKLGSFTPSTWSSKGFTRKPWNKKVVTSGDKNMALVVSYKSEAWQQIQLVHNTHQGYASVKLTVGPR